jgi:hypothetical protein
MKRLGYWLIMAAMFILSVLPVLAEGVDIVSGG